MFPFSFTAETFSTLCRPVVGVRTGNMRFGLQLSACLIDMERYLVECVSTWSNFTSCNAP